ncbi:DUF4377 domain-containing protein [Marinilongibacter aquaticus]|uniref:DUF4377 domain-containing protein n=1 Tax=Marinilongibacter aquaticus TaxID=2975157 RepID=UPI0021BD634E|nr:DUF4377 domain-containing protein [Marinilongibacter aquaticus]UBM57521.1 DUF4377 domain-containing protein [Marinilongibacter aquaticus]
MKNCSASTLFFLFALIFLASCDKDSPSERVVNLTVDAEITMGGAMPPADPSVLVPYITVHENGQEDAYTISQYRIEGFDFEEGYKYELKVSIKKLSNPPEDGHDTVYTLLELVSKTKVN